MAFEELEVMRGSSRDPSKWYISISIKGAIYIWVPRNSPLHKEEGCVASRGTGPDAIWLRLRAAVKGDKNFRVLNTDSHERFKNIRFSTLPFAPRAKMSAVQVETRSQEDGAVLLRLPWIGSDGKPISHSGPTYSPPPPILTPTPTPAPAPAASTPASDSTPVKETVSPLSDTESSDFFSRPRTIRR